jgi:UDP-glucose 4-epimerase
VTWLVTGGAGYIGAHVVRLLVERGEEVVVLDDLSTGARDAIPGVPLLVGDVADTAWVADALRTHSTHAVVHFAAKKQVGESVGDPLLYYRENVGGLRSLLTAMTEARVDTIVFSSSAATYGMPVDSAPIREDARLAPESPYGYTKVVCEQMLSDVARATGLHYASLRYFNVAGAATDDLGDRAVLNLIPIVFHALASGVAPRVFGNDYPTPDGTCIRDYVHVADLAHAHLAAFAALQNGFDHQTFNVGTGKGSSVLEVLQCVESVTGRKLDPVITDRRPGDPACTVASVDKIRAALGWEAKHDLQSMVASAWSAFNRGGTPPA